MPIRSRSRASDGSLIPLALGAAVVVAWPLAPMSPAPNEPLPASLAGQVTVVSAAQDPPTALSPYARRRYSPPQTPGVPGGAEDAVVYLEPTEQAAPSAGASPVTITQRERTIIPHVAVAQVGQRVDFPNEDDVFHNLFSLSPGNRFSLGRYSPGVTETNTFHNAGVVRLFCDIHAEMAGVILVVATPYVARVGADGSYRLQNVPAGAYRAIAWHPVAGADTTAIRLGEGQEATLDFALRAR